MCIKILQFVRRVGELEREAKATPFVNRQSSAFALPAGEATPAGTGDGQGGGFPQYRTLRSAQYRRLIDRLQSLSLLLQPTGTGGPSAPHQAAWRASRPAHLRGESSQTASTRVLAELPRDVLGLIA